MSKLTSREVRSYGSQSLTDAEHGSLPSACLGSSHLCSLGWFRVLPAHSNLSEEREEIGRVTILGFLFTPPLPLSLLSAAPVEQVLSPPGEFTWQGRSDVHGSRGAPGNQRLCSRRYLELDLGAAEGLGLESPFHFFHWIWGLHWGWLRRRDLTPVEGERWGLQLNPTLAHLPL